MIVSVTKIATRLPPKPNPHCSKVGTGSLMTTATHSSVNSPSGTSTFQARASIWSMRKRGHVPRIHMSRKTISTVLAMK